jgi:hypothetical protein
MLYSNAFASGKVRRFIYDLMPSYFLRITVSFCLLTGGIIPLNRSRLLLTIVFA